MTHSVAILGFGTVGSSVAKILRDRVDVPLRLTHIFNRDVERKRVDWIPDDVVWTERIDDVLGSDVDIIVELLGGTDPAGCWVRRALASGKSVVTANKPLVAGSGPALLDVARQAGTQLAFEASVGGGIPVLAGVLDGLSADRLVQVTGILNGTCNYILTRMESAGLPFGAALREAQDLGFAEADPTDDVDGYDARDKLVILSWLGLGRAVDRKAVPCGSISGIEPVDFEIARRLECTIRQVSRAQLGRRPNHLSASVRPALVPTDSPLASIRGSENLVRTTGTFGGTASFVGLGAGGDATAVAVTSDIIAIARGRRAAAAWAAPVTSIDHVADDFETKHCVRVTLAEGATSETIVDGLAIEGIRVERTVGATTTTDGARVAGLEIAACETDSLSRVLGKLSAGPGVIGAPVVLPLLEA